MKDKHNDIHLLNLEMHMVIAKRMSELKDAYPELRDLLGIIFFALFREVASIGMVTLEDCSDEVWGKFEEEVIKTFGEVLRLARKLKKEAKNEKSPS